MKDNTKIMLGFFISMTIIMGGGIFGIYHLGNALDCERLIHLDIKEFIFGIIGIMIWFYIIPLIIIDWYKFLNLKERK